MRWTCTLCVALAITPTLANAQIDEENAQIDEEEETAATSTEDAGPEGRGAEANAREGQSAAHPDDREATTEDPMPSVGTSTVTVDEREARLRREQEAMLAEEEEEVAQGEDPDDGDSLDHEYQVGVRAGIGVPFIFALRYNDGPRCNDSDPVDPDQFCLFVGSTVITFDISFGVTPDVEIVLGGRIGAIGVAPTESNNGQMLLGIRAYISPESIAKVYLAPSVVLDLTPGAVTVPNWGDVDFGVRGAFGVAVDPLRFLGLYVEIGVNILFLRSFGISPDVSGGFQVRFP